MLSKNLVKFLVLILLTYILNLIITSKLFYLTRTSFRCHKIREGLVEKVTEKFLKLTFSEIETIYDTRIYESEWVNQFDTTGFFLYPLKISENQGFSDVSRGYGNNPGMKWVNRDGSSLLVTQHVALTLFMPLVPFYTTLKTSESQRIVIVVPSNLLINMNSVN